MRLVKKTVWAVVLIGLLRLLLYVMNRYSPQSASFHEPLVLIFQVLVVLWFFLTLLLHLFRQGNSWTARFLPVILAMVVLAADVACSYLITHPEKIPAFAMQPFRDYYRGYEASDMWLEPCSIYDSAYLFRLIPGLRYSFGNTEYKNQYAVNSESLRDSEPALEGPQVVCTGNSYTFGQGVEQGESYPALLAANTKKSVLNASNPSYGTVRELKRLSALDTSVLEYLVIQYSVADVLENDSLVRENDSNVSYSEAEFRKTRSSYRWSREYFPGKYAVLIGRDWLRRKWRSTKPVDSLNDGPGSNLQRAREFLTILNRGNFSSQLKILLTDISGYTGGASGFLTSVDSLLLQPEYTNLKPHISTVDVGPELSPEDFYPLDQNMKPSGHRKVAGRIAALIQKP